MKGYKVEDSRLAYLFKNDKEKWKQKALLRQEEKRKMEITIRDLRKSRAMWRERAETKDETIVELEAQLAAKDAEIAALKKKLVPAQKSPNLPLNFNPDLMI